MIFLLHFTFLLYHFIGDFCLQPRWVAESKSSSNKALGIHILIYGLNLFLGMVTGLSLYYNTGGSVVPLEIFGIALSLCVFNSAMHFMVDWATSRLSKKAYLNKDMDSFWMIIGADQMLQHMEV